MQLDVSVSSTSPDDPIAIQRERIAHMRALRKQEIDRLVNANIPRVLIEMERKAASGKRRITIYSSFIEGTSCRSLRNDVFDRIVARLRHFGVGSDHIEYPLLWCCWGDRVVSLWW